MIMAYKLLILVHVIAMMSWVGAMYFNLTLLFPMYKSQGGNRYADLMQAQGTRAAPLLYLLIVLTLVSGGCLAMLGNASLAQPQTLAKLVCLLLMLGCHLYGSLVLWPRVFFALDSEKEGLFFAYRLSMFVSASAGTAAIIASYLWK
ncbi:hypothetical protein R0381_000322 [Jeongeupia wiesaeckerbachi]|uniref:hypothetical protein n=1 Tax=Jeongeupia wiesaeckerbachi TaxID=3051218 RepID=UPI003D8036B7